MIHIQLNHTSQKNSFPRKEQNQEIQEISSELLMTDMEYIKKGVVSVEGGASWPGSLLWVWLTMAEKPEDMNLPTSVVTRIIKESVRQHNVILQFLQCKIIFQLPEGVNVSKDAKSAMSRAASVFILYATTW